MNLYFLLIIVTVISALLQLPDAQSTVIWNAQLIQSGEVWRIVTGNFTHTNIYHLAMNIAALWVISYIFRPGVKSLLATLIFFSFCVGFSLLFDSLGTYAGLSGVLHALFAYYAMQEALTGRLSSWLLVAGVIAKITYEQFYGASQSTAELIGAAVATEAHLAGGIAGLVTALTIYRLKSEKPQM